MIAREVIEQIEAALLARTGRRTRDGIEFGCFEEERHRHGDRNPSAWWASRSASWSCRACGAKGLALDAARRLGVALSSRERPTRHHERQETIYTIKDAAGALIAEHVRVDHPDGKVCFWRRNGRNGLGGLRVEALPLYRTETIAGAPVGTPTVLTEGEKAAEALAARGIRAVGTVTGAAGTPSDASLSVLVGSDLVLWPDADEHGEAHMQRIAHRLVQLGVHPRWFVWADAPPKGDAADYLGDTNSLVTLLAQAPGWEAPPGEAPDSRDAGDWSDTLEDPSSMSFRSCPRAWPSPLARAALHGLAGEIVRAIGPESEADDVALLLQFLVAFGSVIARNAHLRVEADSHYLNLFTVLVGETGKGRKGTSWGQVRRLFLIADQDWTAQRIESGLSSGEGLIWAVRDPIKKMEKEKGEKGAAPQYIETVVDIGVGDKRLLIVEPEFATTLRVIERQGNTLSGIIRQAWDSGRLNTLVKNAPATATDAHISIVGHVTRSELLRYLHRTEAGNGFANRFLFACVRRSKQLPRGGRLSDEVLHPLAARLVRAIEAARRAQELSLSDDAWRIWDAAYGALSEGKAGLLGAVISRAEAQVLRLSGLYALLDGSAVVRSEHLQAALAVWEYCEASARFIFGDALGDPVADEILHALRSTPSGLTRTQIRDLFGRNKGADDLSRALGLLLEQQLARVDPDHGTGGRPAERWFATGHATTKTTETTEAQTGATNSWVRSSPSFRSYSDLANGTPPQGHKLTPGPSADEDARALRS